MLGKKFPQWFIDQIVDPTIKQRALEGSLKAKETIELKCTKGHFFVRVVANYITLSTMKQRTECPVCKKQNKLIKNAKQRIYPQWFIDELVSVEDKQKALLGYLKTTDVIQLCCSTCKHLYTTRVGDRISLSLQKPRYGCPFCKKRNSIKKRLRGNPHIKPVYPQWFIDYLLNDEDKQRAREGLLKSTEKVWFVCPKGHKTLAQIGSKINLTDMSLKRNICGKCGREQSKETKKLLMDKKRIYPQWFIDELVNDEDKRRAISGELISKDKVYFKYSCGHICEQYVGDRINIAMQTPKHGCRVCGIKERHKHRSETLSEIREYPQWFIDDIYDPKVKEQAKLGKLRSIQEVEFVCRTCGNVYSQLVHNHIKLSTKEQRWKGCPICLRKSRSLSVKDYRESKRIDFPEWFIDSLVKEEDKEKARNKSLTSKDKVEFLCPVCDKNYFQLVGNKINLVTGKQRHGCPYCSYELIGDRVREFRDRNRSFPKWFINEIFDEDDKCRAIQGRISSRDKIKFICKKGHIYYQTVQNHICIKNGSRRNGCPICSKGGFRSKAELEIERYVQSLGYITEHKRFSEKNFGLFEVDVFIPEKNIGIEYNGCFYHKTLPTMVHSKDRMYHNQKYYACKELGIRLISIFEPDWTYRKEKIKQYIKDLLTPPSNRVFARKCRVSQIDFHTANAMYEEYHLLGKTTVQSVSYGLFYNNELLSCMSFQKGRYTDQNKPVWCLTRFVTKSGYFIVGGASKLLTEFEKEFKPSILVSYSDNDFFQGGVYTKLGFECLGDTECPRYFWWLEDQELKREVCQLKNLSKQYPELYEESKSIKGNKEDYIMLSLGAMKVYRAGHTKWIKKR